MYLLTYLTGKADLERVKKWKLLYKASIFTLTSNCVPLLDAMRHLKLYIATLCCQWPKVSERLVFHSKLPVESIEPTRINGYLQTLVISIQLSLVRFNKCDVKL